MKKLVFALLLAITLQVACGNNVPSDNPNNNTQNNSESQVTEVPKEDPTEAPTEAPTVVPTAKPTKTPKPTKKPTPTPDPDTWDYVSSTGGNMFYTEPYDTPEVMPYKIKINKMMNCITVYKRNKKGEYTKAVKSFVCSAGSKTPLGTFHAGTKYYWKAMIHGVWAQYATRITGDILFHSVPYDTHKKDTLITSYYNRLGSTASAGCVRLCVRDAKWIMENCPTGTEVTIYNDSNPGPLGKPTPIRIAYNCTWDPTDPDARNPLNPKHKKSSLTGVKNHTVERLTGVNILSGVVAIDKKKGMLDSSAIKIKGKVNTSVPGSYTVTYSFKDSKGKKFKKSAVFTVVDTKAPVISGLPSNYYVKNAKGITAKTLNAKISLSDNGRALDKKSHMTLTYKNKVAKITAHDDYGHTSTLTVKVIEDSEAPKLEIKEDKNTLLPIKKSISDGYARKFIKKASDNLGGLGKSSVKISVKSNGWGLKVTYTLTDHAGNSVSASNKYRYEGAYIEMNAENPVVKNIDSKSALAKFITVRSDETNKKIPYSLSVTKKKVSSNDEYKIYKVTYNVTIKSQAGSKTLRESMKVSVPKK